MLPLRHRYNPDWQRSSGLSASEIMIEDLVQRQQSEQQDE
jgi:hypothetical protein